MQVEFKYSFIYEQQIHHPGEFDFNIVENEVKNFISNLKSDWNRVEKDLIDYLQKITNLKFKSNKINCYVVHTSSYMPISDPLTIAINLKTDNGTFGLEKERYLDMMIHELIHNLFIENEKETDRYFKELFSGKYSNNWNISIHVLVHAIHKKIFDKFFSKERLDEELEISNYYPDYKEAWDIVMKEGEDSIIENLKRLSC